jgi:hypothetical protein
LRVDALNKQALNLVAGNDMPLTEFLRTDHRSFLADHDKDRDKQANYAYAWALAYYLTFVQPVLGGGAMDDYVARPTDPIARFTELVEQPVPEFEAAWRQWVLKHSKR